MRAAILGFALAALFGSAAWAQEGHDAHAGHHMPAEPPPAAAPAQADGPAGDDHAADAAYGREAMAAARARLFEEHGGGVYSLLMLETAEYRPSSHGDGYGWDVRYWRGGDIDRLALRSEGEGTGRGGLERAELHLLYSRALDPYFNLTAGVRRDFARGPDRTYATVGFEGVAPFWFDVGGALFLSDHGEVSARVEGSYDLRITQKLILEPRAEVNLAFQDAPAIRIGSGLSSVEGGLRLRYAIRPELAPYVGVFHESRFGRTADFARAAGEDASDTRFVVGLRAWF